MNQKTKILLAEDDVNLSFLLKNNLEAKGFEVLHSPDGKQALRYFLQHSPELCLLDVMLPLKDGFSLAKEMKLQNPGIPIIFLTSRSMEEDKIKGFETGCDDYITKPFSITELILRVNAVLMRTFPSEPETVKDEFRMGSLLLKYHERNLVYQDGEVKHLSQKETEMLRLLGENTNHLVQRNYLMKSVWGKDDYFISKSMDVYITRLRKLLKPDPTLEILNIYGSGFKLVEKKE